MSIGFWIGAGALSVLAAAFLLVPLLLEQRRNGTRGIIAPLVAVAMIPVAVGVYFGVSTFDPEAPQVSPNAEIYEMLDRLAARLQAEPDNVDGWRLLGRSYSQLQDFARARMAFEEAWRRTVEPDNALKVNFAEALLASDPSTAQGLAGDLLDSVLADSPDDQAALWLGGIAAIESGQSQLAVDRFSRLLATDPPAEIADFARQQIAVLSGSPVSAASPAAAAGPVIHLDISVADTISLDRFGPQARLYILARGPDMPMPLAAIQQPLTSLPGQFSLSDANSPMATGRTLDQYETVTVVARISASGTANEQPGDVYAEATVAPDSGETVRLVLDQVVPEG